MIAPVVIGRLVARTVCGVLSVEKMDAQRKRASVLGCAQISVPRRSTRAAAGKGAMLAEESWATRLP